MKSAIIMLLFFFVFWLPVFIPAVILGYVWEVIAVCFAIGRLGASKTIEYLEGEFNKHNQ